VLPSTSNQLPNVPPFRPVSCTVVPNFVSGSRPRALAKRGVVRLRAFAKPAQMRAFRFCWPQSSDESRSWRARFAS
jgi:hypothetical protein